MMNELEQNSQEDFDELMQNLSPSKTGLIFFISLIIIGFAIGCVFGCLQHGPLW